MHAITPVCAGPRIGRLVETCPCLRRLLRRLGRAVRDDDGMSTAEYAVGTVAAVAFGGVLFKVVTSDVVRDTLNAIITKALNAQF